MEHEVFVPIPAGRLREVLADPVRVARAIPGLQQDASAGADSAAQADAGSSPVSGTGQDGVSRAGTGQDTADGASRTGHGQGLGDARVAGRLKVRVAGHTITYRGAFRVSAQGDGSYAVEGDATEVRGGGAVKLALTLRLLPAQGGTTLAFGGTASGDGRVAELPRDAVVSTGTRLLTRIGEALAADLASQSESGPSADSGSGSDAATGSGSEAATEPTRAPEPTPAPEAGPASEAGPGPQAGQTSEAGPGTEPEAGPVAPSAEPEPEPEAGPAPVAEPEAGPAPVAEPEGGPEPDADSAPDAEADDESDDEAVPGFEADVTSSPLGPAGEDDEFDGEDFVAETGEPGRADAMAEAAHARRTMIGRSAEEVDHAPPRGRYAPVPPPEATAARATLRWAAPAAALALASAIALTRALRKRR
ncbi:carbon monoxide dehydrogenase [Streptomyces sp. NPDC127077]|uniref:carbon monoxide dehydrogenase n=1 Tax=Streptomyces sp. NPDC127077 TaxID=3347131 RepID=UPI0036466B9B